MSFMIESLGDVQARVCNATMPDSEANQLIAEAVEKGGAEIRKRLEHSRQVEKDLYARRQQIDAEQAIIGKNNCLHNEREAEESRRRNAAELKANHTGGQTFRRPAR